MWLHIQISIRFVLCTMYNSISSIIVHTAYKSVPSGTVNLITICECHLPFHIYSNLYTKHDMANWQQNVAQSAMKVE